MDIPTLVTVISVCLAIATFFIGRQTASHASGKEHGERWGRLEATLQHMQDDLREIKITMTENAKSTKESIRRVHDRLDRHLVEQHNMDIPPRKDT